MSFIREEVPHQLYNAVFLEQEEEREEEMAITLTPHATHVIVIRFLKW